MCHSDDFAGAAADCHPQKDVVQRFRALYFQMERHLAFSRQRVLFRDAICHFAQTGQIPVAPFVEDGVLYVALNAVAHIAGLNYAQNELGVAIITSSSIKENESVFAELYRAY